MSYLILLNHEDLESMLPVDEYSIASNAKRTSFASPITYYGSAIEARPNPIKSAFPVRIASSPIISYQINSKFQ